MRVSSEGSVCNMQGEPMNDNEMTITDRHVGRCMERIEQVRMEPVTLSLVKDIVRRELRFLAEDLVEIHDDRRD